VNDADIRIKTMAFLGAISDNEGLEAYTIHPNSITTKEFIEFVEMLSDKFHGQEFAIFMDNLQVHKTKEVLETCKRLKARPIFNVPFSPDFNGIETFFSLIKGEYKKLILERLIKGIKVDSSSMIVQSIQKVE
jgi:transposase